MNLSSALISSRMDHKFGNLLDRRGTSSPSTTSSLASIELCTVPGVSKRNHTKKVLTGDRGKNIGAQESGCHWSKCMIHYSDGKVNWKELFGIEKCTDPKSE
jgi:hypothetical protein